MDPRIHAKIGGFVDPAGAIYACIDDVWKSISEAERLVILNNLCGIVGAPYALVLEHGSPSQKADIAPAEAGRTTYWPDEGHKVVIDISRSPDHMRWPLPTNSHMSFISTR